MQIWSNKFMNFCRGLGLKMKAAFIGPKSLVRDLNRGDGGDRNLSAQGIQSLKTKEQVNNLVTRTLGRFQQENERTSLLEGRAPYRFEGSLLSVVSASQYMDVVEINSLATRLLGDNRAGEHALFQEAFDELLSEVSINRTRPGTQRRTEFRAPNMAWVNRAEKLLQAYPAILGERVTAPKVVNSPGSAAAPLEMTYREFFQQVQTYSSKLQNTLQDFAPFQGTFSPRGSSRQLEDMASTSAASSRASVMHLDRGVQIGNPKVFQPRNWEYPNDSQSNIIAARVATQIDKKLEKESYRPIVFTNKMEAGREIPFANVPMIDYQGNLVGTKEGSTFKPLHANYVKLGISPPIIIAAMPTPFQRGRFLECIYEQNVGVIYDLTNVNDPIDDAQMYYSPNQTRDGDPFTIEAGRSQGINNEIQHYKIKDTHNGQTGEFTRVNYYKWPDHGVAPLPHLIELTAEFNEAVHTTSTKNHQTLLHCRAGVGRSGTLAVASALLDLHRKNGSVSETNLVDIIVEGRMQRGPLFVQTPAQLELLVQYVGYLNSQRGRT